jgi:hypothetical protein
VRLNCFFFAPMTDSITVAPQSGLLHVTQGPKSDLSLIGRKCGLVKAFIDIGRKPYITIRSSLRSSLYRHDCLQAKQVAIRALEQQAIETVLPEHGPRIGQSDRNSKHDKEYESNSVCE